MRLMTEAVMSYRRNVQIKAPKAGPSISQIFKVHVTPGIITEFRNGKEIPMRIEGVLNLVVAALLNYW